MEEGDLVYINYIGKIKESGEIFDTNIEEVAKKANIYNEKLSYKPLPVLIGAKFVFKKIEDTLKEKTIFNERLFKSRN
ncbi:MAG: hypothetical protein B6U78_01300 [Candidatus Aenigmarchaeota archaeon ex4484_224]|nr:MAG: hypothetical protein B6U78_01300 [Candidatus Aenigmarchaeota archaeon ex4484_224]